MSLGTLAAALLLELALLCNCVAADVDAVRNGRERSAAVPRGISTNPQSYHVRAGGPQCFVGLTNAPASNRASISFGTRSDDGLIFRFTNREPHAILLWNVRVQTRSTGPGTDGFGWDTVQDDYPVGTPRSDSAHYPPGSDGKVRVQHPGRTPWRVCVLYSIDWTDRGKSYSGNYEVISQELKE